MSAPGAVADGEFRRLAVAAFLLGLFAVGLWLGTVLYFAGVG